MEEALNMPIKRVNYESGEKPWYFGWSNCNYRVANELRKHYGRPNFLPELSENSAVDWIFIGGNGLGAHMHIDNVRLPSWQAQIKGTKEWTLSPPPECYYECSTFAAIVHTGDISEHFSVTYVFSNKFKVHNGICFPISVALDTNKWYHKTVILPGEISITIGAEYD